MSDGGHSRALLRRARGGWLMLAAALALTSGCKQLGAIGYYLSPEHKQKAEFVFPKDAVIALVFDAREPQFDNPIFQRSVQSKLEEEFRTRKSGARFVPIEDWFVLRRDNKDYKSWSIRRIGQELKAEYVLYLKLDEFRARLSREVPVIEPLVVLRAKVVLTRDSNEKPRIWPDEESGRELKVSRPAEEASQPSVEDIAVTKLGADTGVLLARFFFEVSLEEKPATQR